MCRISQKNAKSVLSKSSVMDVLIAAHVKDGSNVIPFIIEDEKKNYYYRGLTDWKNEKGWLTDTCLDGQDTFVRLLDMLEISC